MSSRDFYSDLNNTILIKFLRTSLATYQPIDYVNSINEQIISLDDSIITNATNISGNATDTYIDIYNATILSRMVNGSSGSGIGSNNFSNSSFTDDDEPFKKDFVFDRTDVRVIFITMYTLVFCCCFFGKYKQPYFSVQMNNEPNNLKKEHTLKFAIVCKSNYITHSKQTL